MPSDYADHWNIQAAQMKYGNACDEAIHIGRPSTKYPPKLSLDGDQWCALFGEDILSGVAGFGDTPAKAFAAFDLAWEGQPPSPVNPMGEIRFVCDGPPGPESGRFVELENTRREGIRLGEWHERDDGLWELRIPWPVPTEVLDGTSDGE